jgi:hypothetical protein
MLTLRFDVLGGYEIISATDGADGIAKAAAEWPDLILMDLNVPGIDGSSAGHLRPPLFNVARGRSLRTYEGGAQPYTKNVPFTSPSGRIT